MYPSFLYIDPAFVTFAEICKSYSGTNLTLGGLKLYTPFKTLIMYGCWPTDILSTGGRTDNKIDLYPAMVLSI